jgi:competence ComEA-like helix-hairpin-helix protein
MFYLTPQEQKTIIFVLALLILGLGLDFLYKNSPRKGLIDYKAIEDSLSVKVDINKATLPELIFIPTLNEKLAQAIIDWRTLNGNFKNLEELKNIKGIKDKKLEKLRKYLTIESHSF